MSVKSLTVRGKLFLLICSISLLTGCVTNSPNTSRSTYASANSSYQSNNSMIAMAANFTRWHAYKLPNDDQIRQERAVFFALNSLNEGETTYWQNDRTGSRGAVYIMASYPQGSGYCRTVNSEIYYRGKSRNFVETACVNGVETTWRFIR
jgi:surface antigen